MDASDGAKNNGNGTPTDPHPVSLPSAAVPPAGGPVISSDAEKMAGPPVKRKADGTFERGVSGNPRGNHKRTPPLNAQLVKAIKGFRLTDAEGKVHNYLEALLRRSLVDNALAKIILDKVCEDATPPASAAHIVNNNAPVAGASSSSNSYVNLGKLLASAEGRDGIAQFAERLAACGALPGEPRNVRN